MSRSTNGDGSEEEVGGGQRIDGERTGYNDCVAQDIRYARGNKDEEGEEIAVGRTTPTTADEEDAGERWGWEEGGRVDTEPLGNHRCPLASCLSYSPPCSRPPTVLRAGA